MNRLIEGRPTCNTTAWLAFLHAMRPTSHLRTRAPMRATNEHTDPPGRIGPSKDSGCANSIVHAPLTTAILGVCSLASLVAPSVRYGHASLQNGGVDRGNGARTP